MNEELYNFYVANGAKPKALNNSFSQPAIFDKIKKLLENNNIILTEFLSLLKSNYYNFKNVLNYPEGRKRKIFNNFSVKKSMIYKDIFGY